MSQPKVFTLRQVVSSIRKTIEERYQSEYWLKVEMHKLGKTPSGHCYPELVQKEDGKIVAEMRGTIWRHHFDAINKRFMSVVKEPLKEDTTLLMKVKVQFHEVYGLSLQITDIDPNYSLGELQRERAETLKKLQKDGLLDANQKLDFPLLPKRIAVISAASSKGLSDFMKVIDENEWGYKFITHLFPAYLQGDQAEHSIIHQLNRIARIKEHFDIVVIVRGGGGEVGMSCYNTYNLCKAIASFPIPILTGIGHSTNLTVAELISYRNAITPTELGDFLIQAFHNFSIPLKDALKSIRLHVTQQLEVAHLQLNTHSKNFGHVVRQALDRERQLIRLEEKELVHVSKGFTRRNSESVQRLRRQISSGSQLLLQEHKNELFRVKSRLSNDSSQYLKDSRNSLDSMEQLVKLVDPVHVLQRGYSITTKNGKTISKSNGVNEGDTITTRTANFTLTSKVLKKEDDA
ncbi:exodeoxyribonuclease VII large subunit [Crocinitomicaceae bacterium]|nr:exodeoxyribonuclease VII large subunit [Crocinitomicaceae bacterium]